MSHSPSIKRTKTVIVSPSLLSADFLHLDREIEMINRSDAQWLHFDVMDGHFVPNISYGFPIMQAVAGVLRKKLDVHFMISNPDSYIKQTAAVGAMMMNVHYEVFNNIYSLKQCIQDIHAEGMKAGVTLNPDTPVSVLSFIINEIDMVLIMGVFPGFGGQKFIPATIDRVREAKQIIKSHGASALIEVDGGVNGTNAQALVDAGADILVSGNYIFKSFNPEVTITELTQLSPR
ncbi:MAG: ribulose-phosphate 3-epimerase [Prevotella sp.]|nr:ribulose-phosphate 3-epimerase [Prevotella sp.]